MNFSLLVYNSITSLQPNSSPDVQKGITGNNYNMEKTSGKSNVCQAKHIPCTANISKNFKLQLSLNKNQRIFFCTDNKNISSKILAVKERSIEQPK